MTGGRTYRGYPEDMLRTIWESGLWRATDFPWEYQDDTHKDLFAQTVLDGARVGLYEWPPR